MNGQSAAERALRLLTGIDEEEEKKKQDTAERATQLLTEPEPKKVSVSTAERAMQALLSPTAGQPTPEPPKVVYAMTPEEEAQRKKDITSMKKQDLIHDVKKSIETTLGFMEIAPTVGTGIASFTTGLAGAIGSLIPNALGGKWPSDTTLQDAKKIIETAAEFGTYRPQTPKGQAYTQQLLYPLHLADEGLKGGLAKVFPNNQEAQDGLYIVAWTALFLAGPKLKGKAKAMFEALKKDMPPPKITGREIKAFVAENPEAAPQWKALAETLGDEAIIDLSMPLPEVKAKMPKAAPKPSEVGPLTYDQTMATKVTEYRTKNIPESKWEPDALAWAREQKDMVHEQATIDHIKTGTKQMAELRETEKAYGKEAEKSPSTLADVTKEVEARARMEPGEEPDIGLGIKREAGIPAKEKVEYYTIDDPIQEKAYQEAHGAKKAPFYIRAQETFTGFKHWMTRAFKDLPITKENAPALAWLRQSQHMAARQFDIALQAIRGWTFRKNKALQNILSRKIYFDDLLEEYMADPEAFRAGEKTFPGEHTPESVIREQAKFHDLATNKYPQVAEAAAMRKKYYNALRDELIASAKEFGFNIEGRFTKENYFRHQILEKAMKMKGIKGAGSKVDKWRSWLTKRGMTKDLPYNTDIIQADAEVLGGMLYDTTMNKIYKKIYDTYDISEKVHAQAKELKLENWRDAIPDGYATSQAREGNVFYSGFTVPEKIALELQRGIMEELIGKMEKGEKVVGDALMMGGRYKEYVVPKDLALTLLKLGRDRIKSRGKASQFLRGLQRKWKVWSLISPRRFWKYNFRNMSGDAEWAAIGNPRGFTRVPEAVIGKGELWEAFVLKKLPSERLNSYLDQGAGTGTLLGQEIGQITDIGIFERLYKNQTMDWKVWKKGWKFLRGATDFREHMLRYANYIEYLDQIKKSPGGMPKNFGASIPEVIRGLKGLPEEMAYQLSNDLLGAYDQISVGGQMLREYVIPFWSWKEVNMKRYYRFIKNAARDGRASSAAGRHLAIKAPLTALRVGRAMIKLSGFYAALQVWNNVFFSEEEADLDENTRNTMHMIFPTEFSFKKEAPYLELGGRTKEGEVAVFTRLGALGDALEMVGLDAPAHLVSEALNGRMSAKEVAVEMGKTASNVWVQALGPQYKIWLEVALRRSLFPDVWEPRPIRDVMTHIARTLAIDNEYRLLPDIPGVIKPPPGKPYSESLGEFFYYHVEPYEAAYHDMFPLYKKFREQYGKGSPSGIGSERSQALYWAKLAWRWGDDKDRDKYLQEYINSYVKEIDITGRPVEEVEKAIEQGLNASLIGMMPTAGMNEHERTSFIQSLDKEERRKLAMAFKFWTEVLLQGTSMSTEEILEKIVEPYTK